MEIKKNWQQWDIEMGNTFDYDENKNEIYKFPAYMISASEVKEIELKKFYHLELIQSKKPE